MTGRTRRIGADALKYMREVPDWVDRHSVNCCLCGDLADERETTKLSDDREAHPECVQDVKVESHILGDDNIEGYAVMTVDVKIFMDNEAVETLWHGLISDAGAFQYGDIADGSVKPYSDYERYPHPSDLAEAFGLDVDQLVEGTVSPVPPKYPEGDAQKIITSFAEKEINEYINTLGEDHPYNGIIGVETVGDLKEALKVFKEI